MEDHTRSRRSLAPAFDGGPGGHDLAQLCISGAVGSGRKFSWSISVWAEAVRSNGLADIKERLSCGDPTYPASLPKQ